LGLGFEVGGFDPLEAMGKKEVNHLIDEGKGENAVKKVDRKRKKRWNSKNIPGWSASCAP
jgi:hypothetical protein